MVGNRNKFLMPLLLESMDQRMAAGNIFDDKLVDVGHMVLAVAEGVLVSKKSRSPPNVDVRTDAFNSLHQWKIIPKAIQRKPQAIINKSPMAWSKPAGKAFQP